MFRINQSGAICSEFGAKLCKFMVISPGHPAECEAFRFAANEGGSQRGGELNEREPTGEQSTEI